MEQFLNHLIGKHQNALPSGQQERQENGQISSTKADDAAKDHRTAFQQYVAFMAHLHPTYPKSLSMFLDQIPVQNFLEFMEIKSSSPNTPANKGHYFTDLYSWLMTHCRHDLTAFNSITILRQTLYADRQRLLKRYRLHISKTLNADALRKQGKWLTPEERKKVHKHCVDLLLEVVKTKTEDGGKHWPPPFAKLRSAQAAALLLCYLYTLGNRRQFVMRMGEDTLRVDRSGPSPVLVMHPPPEKCVRKALAVPLHPFLFSVIAIQVVLLRPALGCLGHVLCLWIQPTGSLKGHAMSLQCSTEELQALVQQILPDLIIGALALRRALGTAAWTECTSYEKSKPLMEQVAKYMNTSISMLEWHYICAP